MRRRCRTVRPGAAMSLAAVVLAACATGGGGSSVSDARWREEMGRSTQPTLHAAVDKVFRKHAVELRRTQSIAGDRELRYESVWVSREVMVTEEDAGVTGARNRIIVTATPLEAQFDGDRVYRVRWQVENEVRSTENPDWHVGPMAMEVRSRFRPVYSDLELELRTGIR